MVLHQTASLLDRVVYLVCAITIGLMTLFEVVALLDGVLAALLAAPITGGTAYAAAVTIGDIRSGR